MVFIKIIPSILSRPVVWEPGDPLSALEVVVKSLSFISNKFFLCIPIFTRKSRIKKYTKKV